MQIQVNDVSIGGAVCVTVNDECNHDDAEITTFENPHVIYINGDPDMEFTEYQGETCLGCGATRIDGEDWQYA